MIRIIPATALCGLLASCAPAQIAATVTRASVSPATLATITDICRKGEPLIRLVAAAPLPTGGAKEIVAFVAGYCDPLLAGAVPPTTDGNTIRWLTDNLAGLERVRGP